MKVLLLLVGTNPLPVYVSWRLLTEDANSHFGETMLVCSEGVALGGGTERIAISLKKQIAGQGKVELLTLEDPGDYTKVRNHIQDYLSSKDGLSEVHLNYTGGTKVMAVAVNEAVRAAAAKSGISASYSYLDPRLHRLRYERADGISENSAVDTGSFTLSLDDLFKLHSYSVQKAGQAEAVYPRTARRLMRAAIEDTASYPSTLSGWMDRFSDSKGKGHVPSRPVEWPAELPDIGRLFAEESGLDLEERLDFTRISPRRMQEKIGDFFHGTWLEEAVLDAVRPLPVEVKMGLEVRPSGGGVPMELDVVALRGHQLFAFSCSRSDKRGLLKQKGFEVGHRASQIGGEEAKAFLVTLLPAYGEPGMAERCTSSLQKDISSDLGGALNVQVLGLSDLRDLNATMHRLIMED